MCFPNVINTAWRYYTETVKCIIVETVVLTPGGYLQWSSQLAWSQVNVLEVNSSPIQVEHDKKRRQFVIRLNGSHDRAVLLYEYVGKKTVDLQHTEVPDAYRGRGIAKHLAKAAMDFVVEEDLKAHLTCWYIQKYVKENPQPQYFEHIYQ
uniref:Protein NATD1 n=1 Tax=Myripristis murdjan TaxID=586833 RepID=A0A667Y619_9TELE